MKVSFRLGEDPHRLWLAPLGRIEFHKALESIGVTVVERDPQYYPDITIIPHELTAPDHPTIVIDRHDTSALTKETVQLHDGNPNVIGYLVPTLAQERMPSHSVWNQGDISSPTGQTKKPVAAFTPFLWEQIYQNPWYLDDFEIDKPIDVSFCGTTQYQPWHPVKHRTDLMREWHQLVGLNHCGLFKARPPRLMSWRESYELTKRSKVVVSPWGMTELSWRDYEAVLGCAVIVKPEQGVMVVTGSPWHNSVAWCRPDFSDLRHAVDFAIWKAGNDDMQAERKNLIEKGATMDYLAARFKHCVETIQKLARTSP